MVLLHDKNDSTKLVEGSKKQAIYAAIKTPELFA